MKNRKMLGDLLLLLTAVIWGTAFVGQRVGMESIEPMTFNAARMALSAVAVGAVAWVMGLREKRGPARRTPAEERLRRRATVTGGLCCGAFLGAASIFQQIGLVYTTAGKAGFITAMYMLLVPVINFVFFRKKNTWLVWVAVLTGVAGMYLLCVGEGFALARGDAYVSVCALLFSGHILCCDHFARRGDPIRISAIQFAAAAVLSGVMAFWLESPAWAKIASAAVPIVYCGILSGGVGYTLQMVAQRFTDPTTASLLMSLESVFAVLAGALLLHERMTLRESVGCAVLFAAVILVQLPLPARKSRRGADGT